MKRDAKQSAEDAAIEYGELDVGIGYLLRRAQVAVFQAFFKAFDRFDIRPAQYSILTIVEHNEGLSQTRVADALGIKKTNLVAVISVLERRGLIRRTSPQADRRTNALYLTTEGRRLLRHLHVAAAQLETALVTCIGERDAETLRGPLKVLAECEIEVRQKRKPRETLDDAAPLAALVPDKKGERDGNG